MVLDVLRAGKFKLKHQKNSTLYSQLCYRKLNFQHLILEYILGLLLNTISIFLQDSHRTLHKAKSQKITILNFGCFISVSLLLCKVVFQISLQYNVVFLFPILYVVVFVLFIFHDVIFLFLILYIAEFFLIIYNLII